MALELRASKRECGLRRKQLAGTASFSNRQAYKLLDGKHKEVPKIRGHHEQNGVT